MDESKVPADQETGPVAGLTPIPRRIHCAATPNEVNDELDEIAIENFLDTLAEVALAIASRKLAQEQDQESVA